MNKYYTVKNRILGDKVAVLFDKKTKQWIESNFSSKQPQPADDSNFQPITGEALARIVNKAFKAKTLDRRTYGSSDFLPFSFLSKGIRCGAPVCLILRQYTEASAEDLIETVDTADYETSRLSKLLNREEPQGFWHGHTSVSTALREVEGLRSRLVKHIVDAPLATGTGFLVGRDHILTNNHVLPDTKHADKHIVRFRYEVDLQGRELDFVDHRLDSTFFYTDERDLDYTLAKLLPLSETVRKQHGLPFLEAGNNFGWLQMLREEDGAVAIPYIPTIKRAQLLRQFRKQIKVLSENFKPTQGIPGEYDPNLLAYENQWARNLRRDLNFCDNLEQTVKEWLERQGLNGQNVSLIQHPKGARKEVVLYGNQVQAIYPNWIQYQTDAEPGSSGSPLFNDQWQLVGLHHSALIAIEKFNLLDAIRFGRKWWKVLPASFRTDLEARDKSTESVKVVGYLGTRICRVVEDLDMQQQQEAESSELKAFLDDYVDRPKRGRIFISAGRKRKLITGLEDKAAFESEVLFKLGTKVVESVKAANAQQEVFHIQAQDAATQTATGAAEDVDAAIAWLQSQERYRPGDVAIEILLDVATEEMITSYNGPEQLAQTLALEEIRGAKVCYLWNQAERKFNAELLLREFWQAAQRVNKIKDNDKSEFPNLGAQPDVTLGRLKFCADVSMPSLVLYAGYLTSEKDCQLFTEDESLEELANGIAKGLVKWSYALSPNMF